MIYHIFYDFFKLLLRFIFSQKSVLGKLSTQKCCMVHLYIFYYSNTTTIIPYLESITRVLLIKSTAALETSAKCSGSKDSEHLDIFKYVCCLSSAPKGLNPDRIT